MKKFFIILLSTCIIMLNINISIFASTKNDDLILSKTEQQKNYEKELDRLIKKYNFKCLTPEEVKAANLNEFIPQQLALSVYELEQIIIKQQQIKNIAEKKEFTINLGQNSKNILVTPLSNDTTVQTITKTEIFSHTSNPVSNTSVTVSAAGTYQYKYTKYPVGPPEYSDLHFISCSNGSILVSTINDMLPYQYKLQSVQSTTCRIISPTRLQHDYIYTLGYYVAVGIPRTPLVQWIYISNTQVNGTTYYNLSI